MPASNIKFSYQMCKACHVMSSTTSSGAISTMLCSALSLPLLNVTLCKQLGCLSIKFPSYVCLSNVCLSNLCLFNLSLSHLCPSYVCLSCKWVASPVCAPASAQLVVRSPPSHHGSQTHSPANTNPHLLIAASLQIPSPLIAG